MFRNIHNECIFMHLFYYGSFNFIRNIMKTLLKILLVIGIFIYLVYLCKGIAIDTANIFE